MQNQTAFFSEYLAKDEGDCVDDLLRSLDWGAERSRHVQGLALEFVEAIRSHKGSAGELESFLQAFSLDTDEGLALMCLAEALLRIPDKQTANILIKDKITSAEWDNVKKTADWVVNVAGFGLAVTGHTLRSALERVGAPFIREAMMQAMGIMGGQFVLGQTIHDAQKNAKSFEGQGYRMSYDMLGEGARTAEDAERFFETYVDALKALKLAEGERPSGISVKLSALYPRYEWAQRERCIPVLSEKLIALCDIAAAKNVPLTVDAEEVDRLYLSFQIIENVLEQKSLREWDGFGLAVQAFQKRALPFTQFLQDKAQEHQRRLQVRLVKGAYWDSEIKRAQMMGVVDYPVFTRKSNTDLSYLACAYFLLSHEKDFYPLFGTHNAHTAAAIVRMGKERNVPFELQRLHGMGEALFAHIVEAHDVPCSIYAPVGPHSDLLAYLVRRLLENGANTSFVNRINRDGVDPETLVRDPCLRAQENAEKKHPDLRYPSALYKEEKPFGRKNSKGYDLSDPIFSAEFESMIARNGSAVSAVKDTAIDDIDGVFARALDGFSTWNKGGVDERAAVLEAIADLYEAHDEELAAILVHEAQKTGEDALAEIREAVDFCRYYAAQGRGVLAPHPLLGPTGEDNVLYHEGRGVFVCISPWNFPLAIFTGQIAAALMAGNSVIAKPAEQTPFIAQRAIALMHQAGVPRDVLQLAQGDGAMGGALVAHQDVGGVVFTGSGVVAKLIQRSLARKDGAIVPLIAETGGLNVMVVDSSALPEQVIDDVVLSAFGSAGQRCSALRILCVQDDIADKIIHMLKGAVDALCVGDPARLSTDVGPVIDDDAFQMLKAHQAWLEDRAECVARASLCEKLEGHYFAPCAYEVSDIDMINTEVFGPILHVVRFKRDGLSGLIRAINDKNFGLTFGVHSRVNVFHEALAADIRAGNVYVNRSMIGAIVGSQPFGGMGLSGTGPKAGGPHYLHAFAHEKVVSIDTTAAGGNASLVSSIE